MLQYEPFLLWVDFYVHDDIIGHTSKSVMYVIFSSFNYVYLWKF